jgi:iron complex outermembrane receptor protein
VRLDGTAAIYGDPSTPLNKQFFASPRVGVVWQFLRSTSVYGQFQNAVNANIGRDGNGVALAAERSREFEAGFKYQAPSGAWTATLATYQLTKRNRADFSLYPIITTVGEARSRGVELDVLGRVTSRLATIFSYGYTEAVVTEDVSVQGTFLADVPRHGGSVWARYVISKNWTAGLGEFAQSFRQGDQINSFILPGYGRTDAMLSMASLERAFIRPSRQTLMTCWTNGTTPAATSLCRTGFSSAHPVPYFSLSASVAKGGRS